MKRLLHKILDIILIPYIYISARIFRYIREKDFSFKTFKNTKKVLLNARIYPLIDHYYQPLFHPRHFYKKSSEDRFLPGVNFNDEGQLKFLDSLTYADELNIFPESKNDEEGFYYRNNAFEDTDAQLYYQILRTYKPKNIVEVGSGYSTKLALVAIRKNAEEKTDYKCNLTCIEPFEMPWLDKNREIKLIREKIEHVDSEIVKTLEENDILFIDSSHLIRPQGDVLKIYLELFPLLKKGVFVHIHDICTPKDYYNIELDNFHFFNEQYLLEAFLTFNNDFEIIAANNYLAFNHYEEFKRICPILSLNRGLGSIWLKRK